MMIDMLCKGFYFTFREIDGKKILSKQTDWFAWNNASFEEVRLYFQNFSVDVMGSHIELYYLLDYFTVFLASFLCFMKFL